MNNKEKDIHAIVSYLQGKKQVDVEEIITNAGADKLRVYPILFELEQHGIITVSEREALGAPKRVTLHDLK